MKKSKIVQSACGKSNLYLKKYSPTILTCLGVVGVMATAVMAARATPKALKLLEKAADDKGENLTKLEVIKVAGPTYLPAILIGAATVSCVLGANILNKRNQASLASAYAMLNQSYQRYKKAANSVYGEDADVKIKAQMAKDAYVSADGYLLYSEEFDPESEKVLCYDLYSERYFMATMAAILNAQYHLNRNLALRGYVSLNEFYEFLGIDKINGGDDRGWSMYEFMENEILWLDFENNRVAMEDGMNCCVISALSDPILLEYE